jgi:hypothetical protein
MARVFTFPFAILSLFFMAKRAVQKDADTADGRKETTGFE